MEFGKSTAKEPMKAYVPEVSSLSQLDLSKRYSYADYCSWKFKERVELIKGFIYKMGPAPGPAYQDVFGNLFLEIRSCFRNPPCPVYVAPFEVRLPDSQKETDDAQILSVVHPDLCIICDPGKTDARGCVGAPDLIVEILSRGSIKKDREIKLTLYEENGVKEYWVADPFQKVIHQYILENGRYRHLSPFSRGNVVRSVQFPELSFEVKNTFEDVLPTVYKVSEPAVPYLRTITSLDQLDFFKRYSYAEYFHWKFEERVELIKGFIHKMSPAPAPTHQMVLGKLFLRLGNFLEKQACRIYPAPFDVRLPASRKQIQDKQVYTVVQPDLCVICDPDKIDGRGCIGAPDLVIEILSRRTARKDTTLKFTLYEENGVKEYWVVDPFRKTIRQYVLENGRYRELGTFTGDDEVSTTLFPKLKFEVNGIFNL